MHHNYPVCSECCCAPSSDMSKIACPPPALAHTPHIDIPIMSAIALTTAQCTYLPRVSHGRAPSENSLDQSTYNMILLEKTPEMQGENALLTHENQ